MDIDRILKPNEIVKMLKHAEPQYIKGHYYILIRPDMRDRIVELLKNDRPRYNPDLENWENEFRNG